MGLMMVTAVFVGGVVVAYWSPADVIDQALSASPIALQQEPSSNANRRPADSSETTAINAKFSHCGVIRRTCVVDGDTFWLEGEKVRIADIDTPEVSQPQCAAEKELGDRATSRLVILLNEGPFQLTPIGNRDEDQYGRKLRVVVRDGHSLGDQLVAEGLARTWTGQREPWC